MQGKPVALSRGATTLFEEKCSLGNQVPTMIILKITANDFEDKYLSLPVLEGRLKARKFHSTKDKALKRIYDWIVKYAICEANQILIKYVMHAPPAYVMEIFKFSDALYEDLAQLIRNIWWSEEEDRKKTHWLAHDKLTRPKSEGGKVIHDQ